MPVPVTLTNPEGKGLTVHKHAALPSSGSLFAKLGVKSVEKVVVDKDRATHNGAQDQEPTRMHPVSDKASRSAESDVPDISVSRLHFNYVGDDGMPLPGELPFTHWV
jgi:hypothetical protein